MMERTVFEYLLNSVWQVPMLAAMAWLLIRLSRPGARVQHAVWLGTLALAVLLPLRGIDVSVPPQSQAAVSATTQTMGIEPANGTPLEAALQPRTAGTTTIPNTQRAAWMQAVPWLATRRIRLSESVADWLLALYFLVVVFRLFQLGCAWRAARRLVAQSRPATFSQPESVMLQRLCDGLGVAEPEILISGEIVSPLTVGGMRPVLVLPDSFHEISAMEMTAMLCHELVHVRRRDYWMNLVCQAGALPIAYHPATYAVQRRVRQTREMVCDATAADTMQSASGYARCLLALAERMLHGRAFADQVQAVGLFDNNELEERIMRLLETKTRMSVRARIVRVTAGLAVMAAGIVTATIFHVVPNMAEAQAATPSQVAAQSVPATPRDKHAMSIGLPASWPLGIANGRNAAAAKVVEGKEGYISVGPGSSGVTKVVMGKGDYIHLWKAADGEPFLIVNRAHQEPTLGEKHRIEKEFKEPRKQVDEANKVLNSPEFKQQMLKMQSELNTLQIPEIQQQAKDVTAQMMHVQKEIQSGQLQREMEVRRLSKDAQAAEAVRPAPVAQPVPQQPAPASSVPPRKIGQVSSKPKVGVHGFALQDGQHRNLTPAQRAQLQAEMAAVRQQIREETRQMQNPEFEQQMEVARKQFQDAIQKLQSEAMQRQQQVLQSPEFKEQIQKMEEMRQKLHGDRSGDTVQHP